MKKVYIKTFGCQMNAHDSLRMRDLLQHSADYQPADSPEEADLILLNTCHIREKAESKLFSELGRLKKYQSKKEARFAVGGCVGQAEGSKIFRRAPFVDLVFGPQNFHRLPNFLQRLEQGEQRIFDDTIPVEEKFDQLISPQSSGPIASVTIQEGCDKFCAFCVVPFTRGREFSRPVDDILKEVEAWREQGAKEILLLGQNVNAYRAADHGGVEHDLALLIRQIALIPEIERIRFVTSHPLDMSDDLVEVFADIPQLCAYFHLPIQSGSDTILAAMERGHTTEFYLKWVERLRQARKDIAIASDFIVGFPGESDKDFQETLDFIDQVQFEHAFSFKFSSRPGTAAEHMDGQIPEPVMRQRLEILQQRLNFWQKKKNQQQIGKIFPVLVDHIQSHEDHLLSGRTSCQRIVHFSGVPGRLGEIVPVKIEQAFQNSLKGEEIVQNHALENQPIEEVCSL
ncbi:tRNA (N6-isopentenyl adenosine(37)-C2)-methylthiotransferase MiaB [Magnetococcales bacterium HHB-1]